MRLSDFYDEPLGKLLQTMELKDVFIKVDDGTKRCVYQSRR